MNERKTVEPQLKNSEILTAGDIASKNTSQTSSTEATCGNGEAKPTKALSPDEQMALYEKELKESDWGHQPC